MDEEQTGNKRSGGERVYEKLQRNLIRRELKIEELPWEQKLSLFRSAFPFVSSKAALQEPHFVRGYACSCRIFAMETREDRESKAYEELAISYVGNGGIPTVL